MATRLIFDSPPDDDRAKRPYHPTIQDVLEVKKIFFRTPLPVEIVDLVLEAAEYWPRTSQATRFDRSSPSGRQTVMGASSSEDMLLLRCCPLGFPRYPGSPSRPGDYMYGALPQSKLRPLRNEYEPSDFYPYLAPQSAARRLDYPCRKIVFTIISRDQGWASQPRSQNPFEDSHTWFEVGLERFEKDDNCTDGCKDSSPDPSRPLSQNGRGDGSTESRSNSGISANTLSLCHLRPIIPALRPCTAREMQDRRLTQDEDAYTYDFELGHNQGRMIQCNKRASRLKTTYMITWKHTDSIDPNSPEAEELAAQGRGSATGDGKFVRSLKLGDVITVWGKARYPAWANHIDMVRVDIYWAI